MKKVLFVLGLAMCSTFAMAQTNKVADKLCNLQPAPQKLALAADKPVDYKASIFTKTDDVVVAEFDFSADNMVTTGKVLAGDVIDGAPVAAAAAHGRTEECFNWHRIPDSTYTRTTQFASDYNGFTTYISVGALNRYMGVRNGITTDNGFMFISLTEEDENFQPINTYFALAQTINIPTGTSVLDITFRQLYRKYYDNCYIDYKKDNGGWISYEVNVTGIDVEVTDVASGYYVATLPTNAIGNTLNIRFRIIADGTLPYGYGWAVDDVKVVSVGATARWTFNSQGLLNGFYGTLPEGFTVPLSYVLYSRNTSVDNLTGVKLTLNHRTGSTGAWDSVFSVAQSDVNAGNPMANTLLQINESGFMYSGHGFNDRTDIINHTYPEMYDQYRANSADLTYQGYQQRGLPTTGSGMHQFCIVASNANGLSDTIDGYTYTVSEDMDADAEVGRTVAGYRWGNDNGIVPSGSEFAYGFTSGAQPGYVTSNCGHQYEKDYQALTRYNTPSHVPTDRNGEPWVFRGIEYVTSTKLTADDVAGAGIYPLVYRYIWGGNYADTGWYNYLGATGLAGDQLFELTTSNAAPSSADLIDYNTLESGNYYSFNILFPDQPAIEPNTSFLLGFANNGGGDFAVAQTTTVYNVTEDSATYYSNNPDLAPYAHQFSPLYKIYDAYAYDPVQGSRNDTSAHTVSGFNAETYPMIRFIVGPKMTLPTYEQYFDCGEEEGDYWIYAGGNACGATDTVNQGSARTYYFIPGAPEEMESTYGDNNDYYIYDPNQDLLPNKLIDAIYIDGQAINLDDENMVEKIEYDFYWAGHTPLHGESAAWEPAFKRYYYAVTMRNINGDHTYSAHTTTQNAKIGNVEDNINLTLAPNPASSQVRLNVAGFSGKANCSIIDMSGRVVYNADITAGETVINLNSVPAGAYFVRLTNDTFSKVEKLIVR